MIIICYSYYKVYKICNHGNMTMKLKGINIYFIRKFMKMNRPGMQGKNGSQYFLQIIELLEKWVD